MKEILELFRLIFSYLAIITMIYPIFAAIRARKNKLLFSRDLQLFEVYVYFVFIFQLLGLSLIYIFNTYNIILFRIFLPIHLGLFSYLLLKWANTNNIAIIFTLVTVPFMLIGDYAFGDYNYPPDFMTWTDAIVLLVVSSYLSYKIDKANVKIKSEYSYIHLGIYLYSIITLLGISPANTEIRSFGFALQSLAIIISNYYFARSFK